VLSLRRATSQLHLVCDVEFAASSHKRWPEATVTLERVGEWSKDTPPEAILVTRFLDRLVGWPDAFDRYYGRLVNVATMELLEIITTCALDNEAEARTFTGYGMPLDVLSRRHYEEEQQAAYGVVILIPERVSEITGPAYAHVGATLQTRKSKLALELRMPPYEPESRNKRGRPEKSLLLGSAALIALVEEISTTRDYEAVVVPTMEELRRQVTEWLQRHDERGSHNARIL
jgi:hypothetical protein